MRIFKGLSVLDAHFCWVLVVQFDPHLEAGKELLMLILVGRKGYMLPVSLDGVEFGSQAETVEDIVANQTYAPLSLLQPTPLRVRVDIF